MAWFFGRRSRGGIGGSPPEELEALLKASGTAKAELVEPPAARGVFTWSAWQFFQPVSAPGAMQPGVEAGARARFLADPWPLHALLAGTRRWEWAAGLSREQCFAAAVQAFRDWGAAYSLAERPLFQKFVRRARLRGALPGAWALNEGDDDDAAAAWDADVAGVPKAARTRAAELCALIMDGSEYDSDEEDRMSECGSLDDVQEAYHDDKAAKSTSTALLRALLPPPGAAVDALFERSDEGRAGAWAALQRAAPGRYEKLLDAAEAERLAERVRSVHLYDPVYDPEPAGGVVASSALGDARPPEVARLALSAALEGPGSEALTPLQIGVMLTARSRAYFRSCFFRRALADAQGAVVALEAAEAQRGEDGEPTAEAKAAAWHLGVAHLRRCEAHAQRGALGSACAALHAAFSARRAFITAWPRITAGFVGRAKRYSRALTVLRDEPAYLARVLTHQVPLVLEPTDAVLVDVLEFVAAALENRSPRTFVRDCREFDEAGGAVAARALVEVVIQNEHWRSPLGGHVTIRGEIAYWRSLARSVTNTITKAAGTSWQPSQDAGLPIGAVDPMFKPGDAWAFVAARLDDTERLALGLAVPSTSRAAALGLCLLVQSPDDTATFTEEQARLHARLQAGGGLDVLFHAICTAASQPPRLRCASSEYALMRLLASLVAKDCVGVAEPLAASTAAATACITLLCRAGDREDFATFSYACHALWKASLPFVVDRTWTERAPFMVAPDNVVLLRELLGTPKVAAYALFCQKLCDLLKPALAVAEGTLSPARLAFLRGNGGSGVAALTRAAIAVHGSLQDVQQFRRSSAGMEPIEQQQTNNLLFMCKLFASQRTDGLRATDTNELNALAGAIILLASAPAPLHDAASSMVACGALGHLSLKLGRLAPTDRVPSVCRTPPAWLSHAVSITLCCLRTHSLTNSYATDMALDALLDLCDVGVPGCGIKAREYLRDNDGRRIIEQAESRSSDQMTIDRCQAALLCVAPGDPAQEPEPSSSPEPGDVYDTATAREAQLAAVREAATEEKNTLEKRAAKEAAEVRRRAAQQAAKAEATERKRFAKEERRREQEADAAEAATRSDTAASAAAATPPPPAPPPVEPDPPAAAAVLPLAQPPRQRATKPPEQRPPAARSAAAGRGDAAVRATANSFAALDLDELADDVTPQEANRQPAARRRRARPRRRLKPGVEQPPSATAAAAASDDDGSQGEAEDCVVCLDRPRSMQLKPCGCVKLCVECAIQVVSALPCTCPWCRAPIENAYEVR